VPEVILDPSPFIFLNAILVFGFTLSFCYDLEKEDRYQDLFVGIGTLLGFLGSCGMAIQLGTLASQKWDTRNDYGQLDIEYSYASCAQPLL
jgi:uncharacterized membrane protein